MTDESETITIDEFHLDIDDEVIRELKDTGEFIFWWEPEDEDEKPAEVVLHYEGSDHRVDEPLR